MKKRTRQSVAAAIGVVVVLVAGLLLTGGIPDLAAVIVATVLGLAAAWGANVALWNKLGEPNPATAPGSRPEQHP
ncbi:hypothetical protein [Streptomyces spiramenti]|uniref:Secreted protein n=1 Tax=Streptomyces spiramenti TaxID=2720606 RepID=A0ABX1AIZ4_9ACTN|nr:hypothetical protein [Streptomyces spiramenti]NJP65353.1 hypothetical protein [Streptomyces spiramenti]